MTITSAQMQGKLLTIDTLAAELAKTEPITSMDVALDGSAVFTLPDGWNIGLKEQPGHHVTEATIAVEGTMYQLEKNAILDIASSMGITREYMQKMPGGLMEPHVNFWATHTATKTMRLLTTKTASGAERVTAFTKPSVTPFSNLTLLETVLGSLRKKYGAHVEVVADYKRFHSPDYTSYRLIVPEHQRKITSARTGGVEDIWSLGIDVRNSLTGKKPLSTSGYLFAWWCTNGAISTHATSGNYSRKSSGQDLGDAMEWARVAVDEILGGLEHEFDSVEELATIALGDDVTSTLQDIFTQYKVPLKAREGILDRLLDSDDLTMYGIMAAITEGANGDVPINVREALMEIGGDLPATATTRCGSCKRLNIH